MENPIPKSRRRYSPEEKQQIIEQWKQSGLSRQAYCQENNLSYFTLIHRANKKRTRWKAQKNRVASEFIPIKIKTGTEQVFAQIEIGNKLIRLCQPVTANFLKQLLR